MSPPAPTSSQKVPTAEAPQSAMALVVTGASGLTDIVESARLSRVSV